MLSRRYGAVGRRLAAFSRGVDNRIISPVRQTKSISSETTFDHDTHDLEVLASALWPLAESVAKRLRKSGFAAGTVALKLKTSEFKNMTRSHSLPESTQRPSMLYETALLPLARLAGSQRFRLIGIGASNLVSSDHADPPDLFENDHLAYNPQKAIKMAQLVANTATMDH